MTREEVIKELEKMKKLNYTLAPLEVFDMAIKALWAVEHMPTTKNNLEVDCISRQAVLEQAYAYGNGLEPDGYCVNVEDIQALPSVTPQELRWIPTSKKLPNKNQWVLVTTEDYQKIAEVMCYQGMRIGQHDVGNGWEEYEYPLWTSGHGDIRGRHPKAWMPLPQSYSEVEE